MELKNYMLFFGMNSGTNTLTNMKKIYFLVVAVLAVTSFSLMAQPPSPPDVLGPDPIPVDGGASLLLVAGISYGAKRIKALRAVKK